MNILKRLLKRKPKNVFPDFPHHVEEAFICDGIQYYQFSSDFKIPCQRALKTITFSNEMAMRVDREFLKKHTEAVEGILQSQKIDIYKLKLYNDQLRDRLNWIVDTDLVYKLASIVYFDSTEDPSDYDFEYNQKKIEAWKKNVSIHDFFYSAPLLALVPHLKDLEVNLLEYSQVTAQIKKQQLVNISPN